MIIFCLENLRSVYNVGSIFRTAEGFGFDNFALIGITPTPIDKNGSKRKDFIKTALGAEDRINWKYFESSKDILDEYSNNIIISLEINQNSEDIKNIKKYILQIQKSENINTKETLDNTNKEEKVAETIEKNILIFIGSEVDGVSKEILEISDKIYHIPMHGEKESFNVSIATGIMMYLIK